MAGKKGAGQDKIDRINNLIKQQPEGLFDGDFESGLLLWGMELHLDQADDPPSQDELLASVTDGKDDLGIDAYFVDEAASTLYLFQSKHRSTPGNISQKDLSHFLSAPERLTTPQVLAKCTNQKILELAPTFREKLLDGFQLHMIFISTHGATSPIDAMVQNWIGTPLRLDIGGNSIEVLHTLTMSDAEDLLSRFDSLSKEQSIVVDLKIPQNEWHLAPAGQFRCLTATIYAEELAKIFHIHKYAIFRDNPRGPLGLSNSANKGIRKTLEDDTKRVWFHMFNNGLSAVCDSFTKPDKTGGSAVCTVQGFQIVNGCQTTYYIWDHWRRGGSLTNTKVTLKLVESPSFRKDISETSNSQSQMKEWDFLFNDKTQQRLQKEFEQLSPPIFYELRRGEYRYMVETKVQKVTIKDIAQVTWAFLGSPGEAKDKPRDVPRSRSKDIGPYSKIFSEEVSAAWLFLPWAVYKRVQSEHQKHSEETGERGDFREHGRLHVLWLIGRGLMKLQGVQSYKDLEPSSAKALYERIDEWFPELHKIAVETIGYRTDVESAKADESNQTLSLRQLFRSAAKYSDFEKAHDKLLAESGKLPALKNAA